MPFDESHLPKGAHADASELSFIERLDNVILSGDDGDLMPLVQYLRSRLLPGRDILVTLEPSLSALLRVQPNSIKGMLIGVLKLYMDEHPESFGKLELV